MDESVESVASVELVWRIRADAGWARSRYRRCQVERSVVPRFQRSLACRLGKSASRQVGKSSTSVPFCWRVSRLGEHRRGWVQVSAAIDPKTEERFAELVGREETQPMKWALPIAATARFVEGVHDGGNWCR